MTKAFSKKLMAIITLLAILFVSAMVGVSYSWFFVGSNEVDLQLDSGSFILQYFHTGDGTKDNPFVITRPIHYYHMVELYQRRPEFAKGNLEKASGEAYYFQIGYNLDNSKDGSLEVFNYDDTGSVVSNGNTASAYSGTTYSEVLNMAYYSGSLALLPMGTSAVPFIGALDGKGLTVKNLHITATETVKSESGTTVYATSDIGVFGYIGGEYKRDSNGNLVLYDDNGNLVPVNKIKTDAEGSMIIENGKYVITTGGYAHPTYEGGFVHDVYFEDVTIDITGLDNAKTYDADGSVHRSLTHMSHVDNKVYIGYLVGHLPVIYLDENGYNADSIFSNVYINDCRIIGGKTSGVGVVQYGYIGHLDLLQYPDIQPATIESMISQMPSSSTGTSGGTEGGGVLPGWGGSLDMRALYDKLSARIGNALGNALVGFLNPAKYITQETIYEEVTKDAQGNVINIEVTDHVTGATANETTKPRRFTVYDEGKYDYEGTLYVYNELNGSWICLSRSSELHEKTVQYYIVTKGASEPAISFEYNGQYLGRTTGGTAIINTDRVNASNLTWDKDDSGNFKQGKDGLGNYLGYLYTHNNGENAQYYLDTDGVSLYFVNSIETATHTVWRFEYNNDEKSIYSINGSDHRIYTIIDGVRYYIVYGDPIFGEGCGWTVAPEKFSEIKLDDKYLNYSNSNLSYGDESTTNWIYADGKLCVKTASNGSVNVTYLTRNNFTLGVTNTKNSAISWIKDGTDIFAVIDNKNYNIMLGADFTDTTFALIPNGASIITVHDGDKYLTLNGTTKGKGNLTNATRFIYDGSAVYTLVNNGTPNYLNATTTSLSVSTSGSTTWGIEGDTLYTTVNGTSYYVIDGDEIFGANNGFIMMPSNWKSLLRTIKSGSNYMQISSDSVFSGTTDENSASKFMFVDDNKFYTFYNGTAYYVNPALNSRVKPSSTVPTYTWTVSGSSCYSRIGTTTGRNPSYQDYYLVYDTTDGAWRSVIKGNLAILTNEQTSSVTTSTWYMITDGSSITGSQDIKDATLFRIVKVDRAYSFIYSDRVGYYICMYNSSGATMRVYAGRNAMSSLNGGLTMNNTTNDYSQYWKLDGDHLYYHPATNTDRYLSCSNGTWSTPESEEANTLIIYRNYSTVADLTLGTISVSANNCIKSSVSYSVFDSADKTFSPYYTSEEDPKYVTIEGETVLDNDPASYNANEIIDTILNSDGTVSKVKVEHYYITLNNGLLGDYAAPEPTKKDSTNYTYLPLTTKTDKDEDANYGQYEASYFNTGYLISGSHSSSLASGIDLSRSDVRVSRYDLTSIDNSLTTEPDAQGNARNFTNNPFNETDDKRLEVLTITQDGTVYRIRDAETPASSHNSTNEHPGDDMVGYPIEDVEALGLLGYQDLWGYYEAGSTDLKYAKFARDNLFEMMNGDSYVYGVRFMDATLDMNHIMKASYVRILGHDYEEYQFPESCIDFRVENSGRISFFAGNWTSSIDPRESIDSFFSLNYVQRKDGLIEWIREVREIYRNNTDSSKYMYRFSDGAYWVTGSGNDAGLYLSSGKAPLAYYTSIFNMSLIAPEANAGGLNLIDNAIYYFEIPVSAGEFALGSVAGHNGAYLLYLDIGANSSNPVPVSDTLQQNMPTARISNDAVFTNVDYRTDGQIIALDEKDRHRSIITISYTVPTDANEDNFSIEVVYQGKYQNASDCLKPETDVTKREDYELLVDGEGNNWCEGVYQIFVKNTTASTTTSQNGFRLSVLLTDNDDDHTNIFPFAYEILVYQNGHYVASPNNETSTTDEGGSIGYNGTLRRWSRNYIINIDGTVDVNK